MGMNTCNGSKKPFPLRRTEHELSICSPCIMKNSSEALRRCQRPHHSSLIALLVLVSIAAQGCAFTGSVFPMAQNSNVNNRRVRRSVDAASSSTSRPNSIIHKSRPGLSRGGPAVSGAPTGPRMASGGVTGDEEEEELSFVDKFKTGWVTVIQEGDPNDLPPCPSGVSEMSKPVQAFVFAAVFAALGAGTVAVLEGLSSLEALLPAGWYSIWAYTWAPLLGALFAFAGVSHFTLLKEFCNIYPGRGAWGFWYLPGTASFHVKWTGVAEFAGGLGLLLGGLGVGVEAGLEQAAAAGLFALTLAVTPANVYMFTHGAQLPEGLEVPVVGHAIRGFFQCVLLAIFYTIALGSG